MDGNVTGEYNQIDTDGTNIYYVARISGSMKLYQYDGTSNNDLGKTNPHSMMFDGVSKAYVMIFDISRQTSRATVASQHSRSRRCRC